MRVLLINASPRGERSNTLNISRAFVKGLSPSEAEEILLKEKNVSPCLGCFSCWGKTSGNCVIGDDMREILLKIRLADVIVESFPLYFFGMPSQLKAMTDRCLPLTFPYNGSSDGFHKFRYEDMMKKKLVVISSCGYADSDEMYPALTKQFDLICGEGKYTSIFCPQGELFFSGMAQRQQKAYLRLIEAAGGEFAKSGEISAETAKKIHKPLLSEKGFEEVTKNHKEWKFSDDPKPRSDSYRP